AFSDLNTGWVGGPSGLILKTTDGGVNWKPESDGATGTINQIRFMDALHGWAVSSDGQILWTIDGGESWHTATTDRPTGSMTDIWMTDLSRGFAVGTSNTLLRTHDGGKSWVWSGVVTPSDYIAVCFFDSLQGYVTAGGSHVLKTTDGGDSWYIMDMATGHDFRSMAFAGPDTVFAVGDAGTMVTTTNGGKTWAVQSPGSWNTLYRIGWFPGVGAWMVGDNGSILHLVRPEARPLTSAAPFAEAPSGIRLFQNYPNPFNPSTEIRYALQRREYVALTVFNTLGQVVTTLVSGEMEPGEHSVRFDGSALASGVYFYRLQAGKHMTTRKLLLLK
ncbi:MAG TPA: YCF48-related protein, partial [Bacteroidota bacterium]|nr:YCF48-related protein [Bacteroidota bacterium]